MAKTQFKKGSVPPNRREIGSERTVSGYRYVKIQDGHKNANWRLKHWVVWEEANGPIPEGGVVIFRDGNHENFDLSNLDLITREKLMLRNTLHNYPEPIRRQIHILAGFKRKLNRYAKEQG